MQEAHPTLQPAPHQSQVSVDQFSFYILLWLKRELLWPPALIGWDFISKHPIIRTGVNPLPSCPLWNFSSQSWPPPQIRSTPSLSPSPSIPSLQHSWAELINLALFEHSLLFITACRSVDWQLIKNAPSSFCLHLCYSYLPVRVSEHSLGCWHHKRWYTGLLRLVNGAARDFKCVHAFGCVCVCLFGNRENIKLQDILYHLKQL